jgi:MFS family permease
MVAPGKRQQVQAMGLIGAGHFMSHFYGLTLPPMFPIFKAEFGVGYAALGLLMAAYSLIGGLLQAPVGYLVDRIGPVADHRHGPDRRGHRRHRAGR